MALVAERFGDVAGREVEWLWQGWFPVGTLCLLGGPPGTAKSMLSVWFAAKVTTGELEGVYRGKPRNVLIVSSEDDLADTIKPRFMAAGGDVRRAFFVDPGAIGLELPGSIEDLRAFLVDNAVQFVVLDPVAARLSDGYNANNDKDVRRALEPLAGMLRDLRVTALGITHMRKATTIDSVSAMMGSLAFAGLSRSVVATQEDDDGSFLFSSGKLNLGRKPETRRYEILPEDVREGETIIETARTRWMGLTDRTVDEVLAEKAARLAGRTVPKHTTAREGAAEFLRGVLESGPRLQREIGEMAKAGGHSPRTLARAKAQLAVISRKTAEGWTWELRHPYNTESEPDDLG